MKDETAQSIIGDIFADIYLTRLTVPPEKDEENLRGGFQDWAGERWEDCRPDDDEDLGKLWEQFRQLEPDGTLEDFELWWYGQLEGFEPEGGWIAAFFPYDDE